jgi:hypothetical protein
LSSESPDKFNFTGAIRQVIPLTNVYKTLDFEELRSAIASSNTVLAPLSTTYISVKSFTKTVTIWVAPVSSDGLSGYLSIENSFGRIGNVSGLTSSHIRQNDPNRQPNQHHFGPQK